MAETLTQIVERAYDALNRRDLDAFLEMSDPEIEITSLIAEAEGGTFRGLEGVTEWWNTVVASLGGIRFEIEQATQLDHEMLLVKLMVSGEAGGVEVGQRMWQSIQVREKRAIWWHPFRTEEEAQAAIEERRRG